MIRTFFLLLLFCTINCVTTAQPPSLSDSIIWALDQPATWQVKLQTQNTFITGKPIRTFGLKLGRNHSDRVAYGGGLHLMARGIESEVQQDSGQIGLADVRMVYGSAYFEYAFHHDEDWRIILPVQLGAGLSWLQDDGFNSQRGLVVLYEPSMAIEYGFLDYFAIGGQIGLRLMLINNKDIDKQFTAPTWGLRFRVKLGKLRRDIEAID